MHRSFGHSIKIMATVGSTGPLTGMYMLQHQNTVGGLRTVKGQLSAFGRRDTPITTYVTIPDIPSISTLRTTGPGNVPTAFFSGKIGQARADLPAPVSTRLKCGHEHRLLSSGGRLRRLLHLAGNPHRQSAGAVGEMDSCGCHRNAGALRRELRAGVLARSGQWKMDPRSREALLAFRTVDLFRTAIRLQAAPMVRGNALGA
jgi:hypothetical protein